MGGTRKVKNVKVSVDGGSSWKKAKFIGPDLGKYAFSVLMSYGLSFTLIIVKLEY